MATEKKLSEDAAYRSPVEDVRTLSATPQVDPAAEKALRRKQDMRIIPLSAGIYFLCYLDRSNIGNAKVLNASTHHDLLSETGSKQATLHPGLGIWGVANLVLNTVTNYEYTIALMM
ncbi:hypothetical protein PG994_002938 [Apiospora phragmitis]|uniref:Uncharacterized protein n=1 Tax=Apiospora phragmitis TaxID=2905665 RepID=A0ABR1W9E9_9PEZI